MIVEFKKTRNRYKVLNSNALMKDIATGDWVASVIYQEYSTFSTNGGGHVLVNKSPLDLLVFVREKVDFDDKFEEAVDLELKGGKFFNKYTGNEVLPEIGNADMIRLLKESNKKFSDMENNGIDLELSVYLGKFTYKFDCCCGNKVIGTESVPCQCYDEDDDDLIDEITEDYLYLVEGDSITCFNCMRRYIIEDSCAYLKKN